MRHPVVKVVGFTLMGVMAAGLISTVVVAALEHKAFYGTNYYGLDLPTYSTLATLALILLVGVFWVCRMSLRWLKGRRAGSAVDR